MPVPLCRGAARPRAAEAREAPAVDEEGEHEQRGRMAAAAVGGEGEGGAADADAGCWILKHD